jgi:hypothetical protein
LLLLSGTTRPKETSSWINASLFFSNNFLTFFRSFKLNEMKPEHVCTGNTHLNAEPESADADLILSKRRRSWRKKWEELGQNAVVRGG